MNIEELKALIVARLDVFEFLDILGFEMDDLVEALEEEIENNQEQFEQAVRE
jgi:hypothetical protein